jgi:signal transduction histidine kinase
MHEHLLRDGHVENLEQEVLHRNGSSSTYSISLQLMDIAGKRHVMSIARDITAMKKMQEVMVQTEKMISVGGIAAGIAHEINNPLGIVLQAAQTLAQRANPSLKKNQEAALALGLDMGLLEQYFQVRKLHIFIEDIQSAALRASTIIRHMLDFSRKSESRRNACQIQSIIDKALELAKNDYDLKKSYDFKNITVTKHYTDNLPEIDCTETEIEQVFLNLLRNAAQAMAQASPPVEQPRIDIRVSAQPEGGQPDRVRVDLTDNGPGMPEDVRRRVFEPFYTTKAPGIGTGLGLSVSYFIITKGHGGTMTVESRPGEGARFRLELPTDALKERTA